MCSWFVLVCEYEEMNLRRIADLPFVFLFVCFFSLGWLKQSQKEGANMIHILCKTFFSLSVFNSNVLSMFKSLDAKSDCHVIACTLLDFNVM